MKTDKVKKAFLDCLRKNPIIQNACDKNNISRQTVYRWKNSSLIFKGQMDSAIEEGEEYLNDYVENKHIGLITDKNWPAIKYHLDKKHPKYKPKERNANGDKLSLLDLAKELADEEEREEKEKNKKPL